MKHTIKVAFIVTITYMSACTKDKIGDCDDFKDLPRTYNFATTPDRRYFYYTPHFNPNNKNEFTCSRGDEIDETVSLLVYNIQTGQLNNIYSSNLSSPVIVSTEPRWGKKNWLVFGARGGNIYKIKSNGDSITPLTFNGENFFPTWNYDGTKIISSNEAEDAIEIIDENGNLLKHLASMTNAGVDWSVPNGLIASGLGDTENQIKLINDSLFTLTLLDVGGKVSNYGICWLDNENILCCIRNNTSTIGQSIYKVNIHTGIRTLIKQGCETKSYLSVSVSSDRQKLLVGTSEYTLNSANKTIESHRGIYLMNIDGSDEQEINLPPF